MSSGYSQSSQNELLPSQAWCNFMEEILDGQVERKARRKVNKLKHIVLHLTLFLPVSQCAAGSNTSYCYVCM